MKVTKELESAVYLMGLGREFHEDADLKEVLEMLTANKVPLLMVEKAGFKGNREIPKKLRGPIEREREKYSLNRHEYDTVKKAFLAEGIEDILFKSAELFPYFPYTSGNIDILVRPESGQKAISILESLRFVELKNVEEPRKFLFKRFERGREVLAIHLHTQVGWAVPFVDNDFIWSRNYVSPEDDPLLTIPSPGLSLLVTLAHTLYEDKQISLLDLARFERVKNSISWHSVAYEAKERGWLDGFCFFFLLYTYLAEVLFGTGKTSGNAINIATQYLRNSFALSYLNRLQKQEHIEMPFRISFLFSKALHFKKILNDEQDTDSRKVRNLATTLLWGAELKLGIRSQKSMLIAISGIDGSGKTSQAKSLLSYFQQCGLRSKCLWSRAGSSHLVGIFIRIGKTFLYLFSPRVAGDSGHANPTDKIALRKCYSSAKWVRFLWYLLVSAELIVLYNLKVRIPLILGCVVICDRYILDALVELSSYTEKQGVLERFLKKLLLLFNPKPDLCVLIEIPARLAMRRTRGEVEAHLQRQALLYRKLAGEFGVCIIEGNQDPKDICDLIAYTTLRKYYHNFGTFIRRLFLSNPDQLNARK